MNKEYEAFKRASKAIEEFAEMMGDTYIETCEKLALARRMSVTVQMMKGGNDNE